MYVDGIHKKSNIFVNLVSKVFLKKKNTIMLHLIKDIFATIRNYDDYLYRNHQNKSLTPFQRTSSVDNPLLDNHDQTGFTWYGLSGKVSVRGAEGAGI